MQTLQPSDLVIDANVFVAGLVNPGEISDTPSSELERQYSESLPYIQGLRTGIIRGVLPRICVIEVCSVVHRRISNNSLVRAIAVRRTFEQWIANGQLLLYDLDEKAMNRAIDATLRFGTRGADSIFISLADSLSLQLKTFDRDILQKYSNASPPDLG